MSTIEPLPEALRDSETVRPLVVDLDGTLICTDMLYESFWRALARGPAAAIPFLRHFTRGRAALKAHLSEVVTIDPATLPYDPAVLALVNEARAVGRMTVLCTASDRRFAEAIGAHLGTFDEIHASDGVRNLKGCGKATMLVERYGEHGFDYIGDSTADMAVWRRAHGATTVGLTPGRRGRVATGGGPISHLDRPGAGLTPYIKAMRPHQWLKNVLIFLPIVAAHNFEPAQWLAAIAAFLAFSLIASSVYLTNDLLDLEADRAHPRKRNRPFASGTASLAYGTLLAPALLVLGLIVALPLGEPRFFAVLAFYYALTTAYSLSLKRKLIIDICTLAGLYTLRVIAGGAATGIPLSEWLLGFSVFFFLSLAAVKRQAELVDGLATGKDRAAGRAYRTDDLPIVSTMAIAAGYGSVLLFALYLSSDAVLRLYAHPLLLWGICPVLLFWVSRNVMTAHRGGMTDDPIIFAVRDRVSQLCLLVIVAFLLTGAFK